MAGDPRQAAKRAADNIDAEGRRVVDELTATIRRFLKTDRTYQAKPVDESAMATRPVPKPVPPVVRQFLPPPSPFVAELPPDDEPGIPIADDAVASILASVTGGLVQTQDTTEYDQNGAPKTTQTAPTILRTWWGGYRRLTTPIFGKTGTFLVLPNPAGTDGSMTVNAPQLPTVLGTGGGIKISVVDPGQLALQSSLASIQAQVTGALALDSSLQTIAGKLPPPFVVGGIQYLPSALVLDQIGLAKTNQFPAALDNQAAFIVGLRSVRGVLVPTTDFNTGRIPVRIYGSDYIGAGTERLVHIDPTGALYIAVQSALPTSTTVVSSSGTGLGAYNQVNQAGPITITVPNGKNWTLNGLVIKLVTSANPGTRQVRAVYVIQNSGATSGPLLADTTAHTETGKTIWAFGGGPSTTYTSGSDIVAATLQWNQQRFGSEDAISIVVTLITGDLVSVYLSGTEQPN